MNISLFELLLLAISMAMDAFTVCLSAGTVYRTSGWRASFRIAFHFGLFQFLMPVLGWFAGMSIKQFIAKYDHWVAFGLLGFVGLRMIRSGLNSSNEENKNDLSRGWILVMLSIAVSIDALAIGLSLGILGSTIWYVAVVIGIVTSLLSWLGLQIGNRLGRKFGKTMEIFGGVVLIIIGIRILSSHIPSLAIHV